MTEIVAPANVIAGNIHGREVSIMNLQCVSVAAFGCGRQISDAEFRSWDALTQKEYTLSGWCTQCQDRVFVNPAEDLDRCTCDDAPCCEVDVGVGVITCGDQHRRPCSQHDGDEEFHDRIYEHDVRG